MVSRRKSRKNSKRRGGNQPADGIITPPADGNTINEVITTPPVAVIDTNTAPEVSITGGGLIEVAVPAALLYSSKILKKKYPSRPQYMSRKSRQILHWRKKARRTQRK